MSGDERLALHPKYPSGGPPPNRWRRPLAAPSARPRTPTLLRTSPKRQVDLSEQNDAAVARQRCDWGLMVTRSHGRGREKEGLPFPSPNRASDSRTKPPSATLPDSLMLLYSSGTVRSPVPKRAIRFTTPSPLRRVRDSAQVPPLRPAPCPAPAWCVLRRALRRVDGGNVARRKYSVCAAASGRGVGAPRAYVVLWTFEARGRVWDSTRPRDCQPASGNHGQSFPNLDTN